MQLSETVKLYMTNEQKALVVMTMNEYISTVNSLVSVAISGISISKYTTADVKANLPSALTNQCIRDAKSIVKKYNKACRDADRKNAKFANQGKDIKIVATVPTLKKPCCYINNQNFKINGNYIEFPVMVNGKSKRLSVKTKMTDNQKSVFANSKLGTMRIVYKGNKMVAQVVYETVEPTYDSEGNVMGIDLGIKCPAVSYTSDGNVKFYGNGRKYKYMRRHYKYLRKKLQKAKHIDAVKRINDKEQRIMRDIDHKISHDIVKTAVAHNVKNIKLERLANIRSTTRTSRKNNHSLHNWSFYRLAQFIEYKAKLAGIAVEYVNPAYTSQTCPVCGHVHHANDRIYACKCGFHIHRDILGAMNICNSTEYVGDSNIRHTA
ncbi:RNA-guided endonuclease InsQ/TnpB family protein [Lachnospira sp.]|jgi:IS605 OrfB family transposase|uniref:RNA-guided endonuclease InsQ/TnpB family protein n=1 Tax=Lachnospira sp. TaxID=2049031 RepID=UPI00257C45C7|nr:transposase [Lachnospira sp.]